ncbi:sodium/proline symporter [Colidextribacter sp. OB.20]|uniref:sodium/proline symporter n=1 Tax=Colidextribacter sp. OB.20 TaxID=2304568 RepID=UPI00136F4572|nr:sodium/proline symporter [Colidextribacter sp. OB.20]NBI09832.1 sodium/proline symporter [Colidextribacter sp. OB.20]
MTIPQILICLTIVLYLAFITCVGVYFNRRGSGANTDEYYLGGRKMGPLVVAMSAEASDMSGWLLMGLPGLAYLTGVAEPFWTAVGLAVGTYFNWLLVAKRLRRYSAKLDAITIPSFFSKRYKDDRRIISCIAAVIIVIFFVPYVASGFKAIGTLFSTLFNVDYHVTMLIGATIIIIYTVLGGLAAVATIDLIQSIVMSIALISIVTFGIIQAGGWGQVVSNAQEMTGYLNVFQGYNTATGETGTYGTLAIVSTLAWGLGYFGMPHILVRFMSIEDEEKLTISRRVGSIWVVIAMGVAVLIGIVGFGVSKAGMLATLTTSSESETVIIQLADLLSQYGVFFSLLAGITLAGIMASTMSTADSQLLAAASSMSEDLLHGFLNIKMDTRSSMLAARGTVVLIAIVGAALAWNPNSSVFQIVSFAWAGFGATFGPAMLCALFWKRSNRQGIMAGLVAGGVMIFVWKFLVRPLGGLWNIYELLPAFLVALLAIVIVSLATPAPEADVVKAFEEYDR